MEGELKKKGMYNERGLIELRESLKNDLSDIVSYKPSSWYPENFKDGDWKQGPLLFE